MFSALNLALTALLEGFKSGTSPLSNSNLQVSANFTDDDLVVDSDFEISWLPSSQRLNHCIVRFSNESENFKEDSASWPPKVSGLVERGIGGRFYIPQSGWDEAEGPKFAFLNRNAVWAGAATKEADGSRTFSWKFFSYIGGTHTLKFLADNSGTLSIQGNLISLPNPNLILNPNVLSLQNSTNLSITSNVIAAPDGTMSADRMTSINTGSHYHQDTFNAVAGQKYCFSFYIKKVNSSLSAFVSFSGGITGSLTVVNTYNYEAYSGVESSQYVVSNINGISGGISFAGNDWYRVHLIAQATSSDTSYARIATATTDSEGGGGSFNIWGRQLENSSILTEFASLATVNSTNETVLTINSNLNNNIAQSTISLSPNTVYTVTITGNDSGGELQGVAGTLTNSEGNEIWSTKSPAYTSMEILNNSNLVYKAFLAEDNEVELEEDVFAEGVTDYYHALAKAEELVRTSRSAFTVRFKCFLKNKFLEPGDYISINSTRLQLQNLYLRVSEVKLDDLLTCTVTANRFDWTQLAWNVKDNEFIKPRNIYDFQINLPYDLQFYPLDKTLEGSSGRLTWKSLDSADIDGFIVYLIPYIDNQAQSPIELGKVNVKQYFLPSISQTSAAFGVASVSKLNKKSEIVSIGPYTINPNFSKTLQVIASHYLFIQDAYTENFKTDPIVLTAITRGFSEPIYEWFLFNPNNSIYETLNLTTSSITIQPFVGPEKIYQVSVRDNKESSLPLQNQTILYESVKIIGIKESTRSVKDLTPPPQPSGFILESSYTSIKVSWNEPSYSEGGGHYATAVYIAKWDVGPQPSFSQAYQKILVTDATEYVFNSDVNQRYVFWIKNVSKDRVYSTDFAGPLVGFSGVNIGNILQTLTSQITESQLYQGLQERLDQIDDPSLGLLKRTSDLETVYGDVSSAASSAQIALQKSLEATQAAGEALLASTEAKEAKDLSLESYSLAASEAQSASVDATSAAVSATGASVSLINAELAVSQAEAQVEIATSKAQLAESSASAASAALSGASTIILAADASIAKADITLALAETEAETAGNYATAAGIAAVSASNSSTSAIGAAANANTFKQDAETAASTATSKANAAAQSELNASNSAATANTAAANANTFKQDAQSFATAAENYASAAATSEINSQAYATDSESFALISSEKADLAISNAGSAQSYANSAAGSATDAEGYANSAATSLTGVRATATGFYSAAAWDFKNTSEGWTGDSTTITNNTNTVTITSSSTTPLFTSPYIAITGNLNTIVRMRVKRTGGSGWLGRLLFKRDGDTAFSTSYRKDIADGTFTNEWRVLEWDMAALTAGTTNWITNQIAQLQFQLGNTASDVFEIDWIAVGSISPDNAFVSNKNISNSSWWVPSVLTSDNLGLNWVRKRVDSGNDSIVIAEDHNGKLSPIWKAIKVTAGSSVFQGGFEEILDNIDRSKTYRFILPIKRIIVGNNSAKLYFGCFGVRTLNTSTANTNPYFIDSVTTTHIAENKWYLAIGYIYPYAETPVEGLYNSDSAGVFDIKTGVQVKTGLNYQWNASTEIRLRAYLYGTTDTTDVPEAYFGKPLVHLVDGSEPPLDAVLKTARDIYADVRIKTTAVSSSDGSALADFSVVTDANGQVAGFGLSSQMVPAGPDLITNGAFDSDTSWTKGTGWSISGGVASKTTGNTNIISQAALTITANVKYKLTYDLTVTSGSITPQLTSSSTVRVSGKARSSTGSYFDILRPTASGNTLRFLPSSTFVGSIDNVKLYVANIEGSEFHVNADRFSIGPPNSVTGNIPFTVLTTAETANDGTTIPPGVYIDDAFIKRITADKIDTRGLSIRDANNNIIFAAGTPLSTSNISGLGSLATANSVGYSEITGTKPPSDADKTSSNTAAGIANQGAFATLNKITPNNVSTYIDNVAIKTAQIADLAVTSAKIGNLEVGTAKIANEAVSTITVFEGNSVVLPITGTTDTVLFDFTYDFGTTSSNISIIVNFGLRDTIGDAAVKIVLWNNTNNKILAYFGDAGASATTTATRVSYNIPVAVVGSQESLTGSKRFTVELLTVNNYKGERRSVIISDPTLTRIVTRK